MPKPCVQLAQNSGFPGHYKRLTTRKASAKTTALNTAPKAMGINQLFSAHISRFVSPIFPPAKSTVLQREVPTYTHYPQDLLLVSISNISK